MPSSADRIEHGAAGASNDLTLVAALPGLVRITAAMSWKATGFGLSLYIRATSRVLRAAANGESVGELMQDAGSELREYLRQVLEIVDQPQQQRARPAPADPAAPGDARTGRPAYTNGKVATSPEALKERGAELLRRSADVHDADTVHPAFSNVLENLAPDEGRILRLLALEGPQPAVDIRSSPPLGIGSEMVASGMNMIGAAAGLRQAERVQAYLANLYRLGLIWFSREQLEDQNAYQVLEAQPEVQVALSEAGRTRTVRRSINLTPFGREFCDAVLPLDTGEIDALPGDGGAPAPRSPSRRRTGGSS